MRPGALSIPRGNQGGPGHRPSGEEIVVPGEKSRLWQREGHLPALDGIRGLSVLAVVLAHTALAPPVVGPVAMVLFFTLSGFLITRLLSQRTRSLRRFYVDRIVRLTPPFVVMVAVVVAAWAYQGRPIRPVIEQSIVALLYVENFYHDRYDGGVFAHTWSLAVEEQFYLLWPVILGLLLRGRRWVMALLLAAAILTSVALRFLLVSRGEISIAYASLPTNAYALLAGCTLCWLPAGRLPTTICLPAGAVGLAVLAIGASHLPVAPVTVGPLAAVFAMALITGAIQGSRLLESAPLRFLGRVSYAWYLWHVPVMLLQGVWLGGASALGAAVVSLALATASTRLLEEPVRRRWRSKTASQSCRPNHGS